MVQKQQKVVFTIFAANFKFANGTASSCKNLGQNTKCTFARGAYMAQCTFVMKHHHFSRGHKQHAACGGNAEQSIYFAEHSRPRTIHGQITITQKSISQVTMQL
jgi:hypothetical protein